MSTNPEKWKTEIESSYNNLPNSIERILKEQLEAETVQVYGFGEANTAYNQELSGHYEVEVAATTFAGKTLIQQHRLVYDCLKEQLKEQIHALVIRTKIPTPSNSSNSA